MIHLVSFPDNQRPLTFLSDDSNCVIILSGNSSLWLQHLLEVVLSAVKLEEAHFDPSEEEWKERKERFHRGSATYLYCQLRHLSVQHLQAGIVRHQRLQQAHQSVQLESHE